MSFAPVNLRRTSGSCTLRLFELMGFGDGIEFCAWADFEGGEYEDGSLRVEANGQSVDCGRMGYLNAEGVWEPVESLLITKCLEDAS